MGYNKGVKGNTPNLISTMTHPVLVIACAAITLGDRRTWEAFDWNRSECGLAEAINTLKEDIVDGAAAMAEGYKEYDELYRV